MKKLLTWESVFSMVKTHFSAAVMSSLLGMFIFGVIFTNDIANIIFTIIFTLIYLFAVYFSAGNCATRDKKAYTDGKPYFWKGLLLPVGILALSIILYALYKISWEFMTINDAISGVSGMLSTALFIVWSFMFNAFIGAEHGALNFGAGAIIIFLTFAASFAGYFACYRNFDLSDKLAGLIYEKRRKK